MSFQFPSTSNNDNKNDQNKPAISFNLGSSSADSAKSSFGGFNLGVSTTPSTTDTKSGGFSFGSNSDNKPENKPLFGASSTTSGGLFGSSTSKPTSGFSLGSTSGASDGKKDDKPAFSFGKSDNKPSGTTGGLFGAKADSQPASTFSFGAKTDNKPAASTFGSLLDGTKNTKPAPTLSFGSKSDDKAATEGLFGSKKDDKITSSKGGFTFGLKKEEEKKDETKTTPFSFGAKKEEAKPSAFSFGTKKSDEKKEEKSPTFSFGVKKDEAKKEEKPPALSFGSKKENEKKEEPKLPAFSFGTKKEEENKEKPEEKKDEKPLTSTIATVTKQEPTLKPTKIEPQAVSIDNKTMDDLIIKWSKQLTSTSKIFDSYTSNVKEWDQQLVLSGEEISKLNQDTLEAESLQVKIDQHLLFVENQQDELEKLLDNYEHQADILLNNIELNSNNETNSLLFPNQATGGLSVTDKLREKAYHNAELLDEKLDNMSATLSTLINEINSVSDVFNKNLINDLAIGKKADDNPIEEIVKLLNLHLENLKYIENSEEKLKEKLLKVSRNKHI